VVSLSPFERVHCSFGSDSRLFEHSEYLSIHQHGNMVVGVF
jgi:hypothetical protein